MADTVTITFPGTPVYELSPNARTHYMTKARAVKEAKETAFTSMRGAPWLPFFGPVELDWTIRLAKGRKAMDWDNAVATLKPYMDVLVMAAVILDDKPSIVTRIGITDQINWSKHRVDGGEIVVRITEVAA